MLVGEPSPKSHTMLSTVPSESPVVEVNSTVTGALPKVGVAEIDTVGATLFGLTVTVTSAVDTPPLSSVTVSWAV